MSSPPIVSSCVDAEPQQRDHDISPGVGIGRRIRARDPDVGTAAKVDAADGVDGEGCDVFDVTPHQPFEAVAYADHLHAFEHGADGRGADHAVDARCRSAADKNRKLFVMYHA